MSFINIVKRVYIAVRRKQYQIMTVISPTLNTKVRYRAVYGKYPDLKAPKTFHEKLIWLKLYRYQHDPLVIRCSDKYMVRQYVEECGCGALLNDLIGVWEDPKDICWEELPDQFALKWNFGAGMNVICCDKRELCRDETIRQLQKWKKNKCWLGHAELHYKYIPKRVICEKYLEETGVSVIPDYKVYCFHGKPKAVFVMQGRGQSMKTEFFDTEWTPLRNTSKYPAPEQRTTKPVCLQTMLEAAEKLSKPFPFVRCDFYVVQGRVYFGELTFTPAAGLYTSQTDIHGVPMSDLIDIHV